MKKTLFAAMLILAVTGTLCIAGCEKGEKPENAPENTEKATELKEEKELKYPEKTEGMFTAESLTDWVKWNGRSFPVDQGRSFDWSGSGFSLNLETEGTELKLFIRSDYDLYVSVYMDGSEIGRPLLSKEESFVSVPVPGGRHEITVYKDTEVNPTMNADLIGLDFEGTLLPPPEKKERYFEFYGASIETAQGVLGTFVKGEKWVLEDHSATHSYAHLLAKKYDADYAIVAKGGIGVLKDAGGFTLPAVFSYTEGFRDRKTKYDFQRRPDLVVVQLGGNDSGFSVSEYKTACEDFIRTLRAAYAPEIPIIWLGRNEARQNAVKEAAKSMNDGRLYVMNYTVKGEGSAALTTQDKGHPNAAEHEKLADEVYAFIEKNGILK